MWRKLLLSCVIHLGLLLFVGSRLQGLGAGKNPAEFIEIELAAVNHAQANQMTSEGYDKPFSVKSNEAPRNPQNHATNKESSYTPSVANAAPASTSGSAAQTDSVYRKDDSVPGNTSAGSVGQAYTTAVSHRAIEPPKVLIKREPAYPEHARNQNLQGSVTVEVEVLESGKPGNVVIVSSSGHDILDRAAVKTVRQWVFVPAKDRSTNVPLRCVTHIPISFQLD